MGLTLLIRKSEVKHKDAPKRYLQIQLIYYIY